MNRALALLSFLSITALGFAQVPRVFVLQLREAPIDGTDRNLLLDSYVAQSLFEEGQVEPVVWSMTDPAFRKIVDEQNIPTALQSPTQENITKVARLVKPDYTLVVWGLKTGDSCRPIATLYRGAGSRTLWRFGNWDRRLVDLDQESQNVTNPADLAKLRREIEGTEHQVATVIVGGLPDWDSTSRSIARSWAMILGTGPFRDHPRQNVNRLPDPTPGNSPTGTGVQIPSDDDPLVKAQTLIRQNKPQMAVLVLREAIDKDPFDPRPREMLANLLIRMGLYEEAAAEAERAALVSKDSLPMWMLAARAYLLAWDVTNARNSLNQALARGAQGHQAFTLQGEIAILANEPRIALDAFTSSIAVGPTPQAVIGRAMAHSLIGNTEECRADLASLGDVDPATLGTAYLVATTLSEQKLETIGLQLRELPPLIRMRSRDPELIARAAAIARQAEALSALIDLLPTPSKFTGSHTKRALAHKLMLQSSQEILEFAQTGKTESGDEGTVSLGEALRLLPMIRADFRVEQNETESL